MRFASVLLRLNPIPAGGGSRRFLALGVLLLAACAGPGLVSAQTPGTLDPGFTSGATGSNIFALADEVIDLREEIIVGGDLDLLDRLYLSGAIDPTFKLADFGNLDRLVFVAVPQYVPNQADHDKTLVGGLFGSTPTSSGEVGTGPAQNIQRLNSDGLLDVNFKPGYGANDFVTSIVPEADGTIYVGGRFQEFNRVEHEHVVRLTLDGAVDPTFASNLSIEDAVLSMADQIDPATGQPNGQLLIVGTFNRVDQTNTAKVARLNSDGSLDKTFNPVIDTRVLAVVVQPDGKIIIGGAFNSVNGTPVHNIARLNFDGSLDTTFQASVTTNPTASPDETAVYVFYQLSDGLIYVGGNFFSVDGVHREYLARLFPDGTLDTTFDPGTAVINSVQSLAVQQFNNRLLVGETISRKVNNVFPASLVRLYSNNPPLITIAASKPAAAEKGAGGLPENGQFILTRSGTNISAPLTVYLTAGGTAVNGVDYKLKAQPYSGAIYKVTFQANSSTATVGVRPTGATLGSSPETVTLTLQPVQGKSALYLLDSQTSATVSLSEG